MENEAEAHALKENVQYYKYNKTMCTVFHGKNVPFGSIEKYVCTVLYLPLQGRKPLTTDPFSSLPPLTRR